jgi:hypothetical protein
LLFPEKLRFSSGVKATEIKKREVKRRIGPNLITVNLEDLKKQ